MVWFHVDPKLAAHHKFDEAGLAAMGLWLACGCQAAGSGSDGFVPTKTARKYAKKALADRLVNVGLWVEVDGGYQFHDWEHCNPPQSVLKSRRESEAARKREQRKHKNVPPDVRQLSHPMSHPMSHNESAPCPADVPPHVPPDVFSRGSSFSSTSGHLGGASNVSNGAMLEPSPPSGDPPKKNCKKHLPHGTDENCGACKTARLKYESWLAAQSLETKRQAQEKARAQTAARIAAIHNCTMCDTEGYRPNRTICDHIDRSETHRNGISAVRAALKTGIKTDQSIKDNDDDEPPF